MFKNVLIVDDSVTARMFVRRCLEITRLFPETNYFEAGHGREALVHMKANPMDLVFTDLTMPEMDGESLLAHIKASPRFFDIPVVVVSSAGNPARDKRLLEMGAVGVLKKPITPQPLLDILHKVMDTHTGKDGFDVG